MKRLLISTLSVLVLNTIVTPACAEQRTSTNKIDRITPFNLVTGSYQGRFEDRGIPSFALLIHNIRFNRIEAEDLVEAAIADGRLPEDAINDKAYLRHVDSFMEDLIRRDRY